jgi:hypothetical protein
MSYKRKKLFIVVTSPFTERDFYRYGINTFIKNGFQIKVLDLHSLLYNGIISSKISFLAQKDIIVHVKTWDELFKMFRTGLNESIVYTTTALTYKSYPFYRILKKLNIPYIVNSVSVIPTLERNIKYSILNRLFPITLEKICNLLLRKLPLTLSRLSPAYAVIAHGVKSNMNRKEVVESTKIIYSHTFDYDLATQIENAKLKQDGTAVFLDSYLPYHSDYNFYRRRLNTDLPRPLVAQEYYNSLNLFFDHIEKQTGFRIVIAAHPRSNYSDKPDCYVGREIVKNNTAELVAKSSLVILEQSTAINFAVIFRKQMLFVTSPQLIDQPYGMYTDLLAGLFESKALNIASDIDLKGFLKNDIDYSLYESYTNNYIKTNWSPLKESWQIVCDFIDNEFNIINSNRKNLNNKY